MKILKTLVVAATTLALTGAAYAAPVFQGRLSDGTASTTCTASGATKCAMFYNTTLNVTILNDWNIGGGFWSATAAAGSAQALAESAGAAQTDFTGWFLPTGDRLAVAGALNQYRSIWNDVGSSFSALQAQFDGVQPVNYASGSLLGDFVWVFRPDAGDAGIQFGVEKRLDPFAVAVRPGDVAVAVPEPQTLALVLLALGATMLARRRRSR